MVDIHWGDERGIRSRRAAQRRHAERCIDLAEIDLGAVEALLAEVEEIGEDPPDLRRGLRYRVGRDRLVLLQRVEAPHIVESEDMVGMRMGEEHGIDLPDPVCDGLLAEIGRGIEQDGDATQAQVEARTQAPVARIGRSADGAVAADHRHAGGGAGTEEEEFKRRFRFAHGWNHARVVARLPAGAVASQRGSRRRSAAGSSPVAPSRASGCQ